MEALLVKFGVVAGGIFAGWLFLFGIFKKGESTGRDKAVLKFEQEGKKYFDAVTKSVEQINQHYDNLETILPSDPVELDKLREKGPIDLRTYTSSKVSTDR